MIKEDVILEYIISMVTIYKIWSEKGEKVYIGSTTDIYRRWATHRAPSNDTNSRILFDEYGKENCQIDAIEEVKEDEKLIRERHWIEFYGLNAVNERIPGRTDKEYREMNKEYISQKNKEWREENKESILLKRKEYYEENKDRLLAQTKRWVDANKEYISQKGKEYYNANKEAISQKDKVYREANRDRINAYDRERGAIKVHCEVCNEDYRRDSIHKHFRSKKHLSKVNNISTCK